MRTNNTENRDWQGRRKSSDLDNRTVSYVMSYEIGVNAM